MTTLEELKQLIHTSFAIDPGTLKSDTPLSDYGLDSLSLAELMFAIDDHFNIEIPDNPSNISTLDDLAALIDQLRTSENS